MSERRSMHRSNVLLGGMRRGELGCSFELRGAEIPTGAVQLLPEHSEAADRIPHCTTHDHIRQEMDIDGEP
jgi:hypothetical protein